MNLKIITILIIIFLLCGLTFFFYQKSKNLELKVQKQQIEITQLEGKVVDQETEISILKNDNKTKQNAISALETRVSECNDISKQTIDDLLELSKLDELNFVDPRSKKDKSSNSAAGKKENPEVLNDESSKKFIDMRNNIYDRYK